MGREPRIGLLLGAAACLVAVMVDWVIEDLRKEESSAGQDSLAEPMRGDEKESAHAAEAPATATT